MCSRTNTTNAIGTPAQGTEPISFALQITLKKENEYLYVSAPRNIHKTVL